ncbi:hypothetical protein POM88_005028 [Heracleum sosnowskyi]|uniref:C2H2-type domain-containing protein n=1 Tax=Heracleum sosnowskyi TaxID=360622 RepID=A0AAD8NEY6_9APIA|nr:hypothetical protein POM88_005028 [Heracleum sosnowskyi]
MSNPDFNANNKENIPENNIPARRYPCPHCSKSFSTQMAMAGHQNAHRIRRPIFTSQGVSGPSLSPALRMETPFPFSCWNSRHLQEYFARLKREEYLRRVRSPLSAPLAPPCPPPTPLAPQVQPTSTMFFGVRDFFRQPSVAPTTPLGEGASSGRVFADEEDEKEDLDLKL